jgi:hypothetical protein
LGVVRKLEWPASIWTSRSDPPTVKIFLAVLVIKVRLPEWLEQQSKPTFRYHRQNRLTTACGDIPLDRSLAIRNVLFGMQLKSCTHKPSVTSLCSDDLHAIAAE